MRKGEVKKFTLHGHSIRLQIQMISNQKEGFKISGTTKTGIWFTFKCDKNGVMK